MFLLAELAVLAPQAVHELLRQLFRDLPTTPRGLSSREAARRLVRDYERLPDTFAGLHLIVFACLMLHQWMAFANP